MSVNDPKRTFSAGYAYPGYTEAVDLNVATDLNEPDLRASSLALIAHLVDWR